MRSCKLVAGGILTALLLAACGGTAAPAAQGSGSAAALAGKPEKDHIKLVYATASGEDTFVELAASKGFFQKYGLTADVQYAQSTTAMAAVTSGEAQMALSDGVSAVDGVASGTPYKIVAYFDKTSPYMIASLPEIATFADLKGKTVAVGKIGDTSDVSMRIGVKSSGLIPGKDFNVLQVGNSPARWAALSSKQVGAAILDEEAYRKQAEAQGMHILASLHSEGMPYVASALLLTSSFAKDNPNTVLATLRGLMDGVAYFADEKNKADVMALMAKLLRMDVNSPELASIYNAYHTRAATDPTPDKAGIDTILDALKSADPNRYGSLTSDQLLDPSFMAKLKTP
ncbi:MAG TPA: ABC transporter substrate-binding protein [Chloroflexota bacterium]|nr:ABC transporter substrate-binding protein [Chloroflexota bacterium]